MAIHEALIVEETNVASSAQIHSRHPSISTINSSLPTDSMVTVRLSDPPLASASGTTSQITSHVAPLDCQVLEGQQKADSMWENNLSNVNDDAAILDEESHDIEAMASLVEEEQSIRTFGTVRSRSDTSGSFSSNGSAQVDWDELERSEEQAPRDEGTDEVNAPIQSQHAFVLTPETVNRVSSR